MGLPSLLAAFAVALFFFSFPRFSTPKEDDKYRACSTPYAFDCGRISNVSYPFLAGARPVFCGYQELHLTCEDGVPKIELFSVKYQVKNISYSERLLTLVDAIILDDRCPTKSMYQSIEGFFFEFNQGNSRPTTLVSGCSTAPIFKYSEIHNVSCPGVDNGTKSSYWLSEWYPDKSLLEACSDIVEVRLPGAAVDRFYKDPTSFMKVMKEGVEVRWKVGDGWCTDCQNSGGVCGFNQSSPGNSACFCPDGPQSRSCSSPSPSPGRRKSSSQSLIILVASAGPAIIILAFLAVIIYPISKLELLRKVGKRVFFWKKHKDSSCNVEAFLQTYGTLGPKRYEYSEIKKMTNFFKQKLGEGGYGSVFKGKLPNGREVAVKLLTQSKGNGEEFVNEVASIGRTYHVNVVTLLGFCSEGSKRALVYELMPNGSLEKFIFSRSINWHCTGIFADFLGWEKLLEILIGIARGLDYLHRGCNMRILHFDIKPHNILLDHDFCPKISDFGLAKLCPSKDSIISMLDTRGTIGYIAPELFCRNLGGASYKSDVYSYGMMVLEMAGGRHNLDAHIDKSSQIYFPQWIYSRIELNQELGIQDVVTNEDERFARKMIKVGLWCIQTEPPKRPSMSKVVEMLEGDIDSIEMPPKPFLSPPTSLLQESSTSSVQFLLNS